MLIVLKSNGNMVTKNGRETIKLHGSNAVKEENSEPEVVGPNAAEYKRLAAPAAPPGIMLWGM